VAIEEMVEHPVRFTQLMISAAHAAEHVHRSAIVANFLLWQNEADGVRLSTAWQLVCDPLSEHLHTPQLLCRCLCTVGLAGRSRQALGLAPLHAGQVLGTQAMKDGT
jgi:hypothetical protein